MGKLTCVICKWLNVNLFTPVFVLTCVYPETTLQCTYATTAVILKDDGTSRSVIRPIGGRRVDLSTADAVPSSVPFVFPTE